MHDKHKIYGKTHDNDEKITSYKSQRIDNTR